MTLSFRFFCFYSVPPCLAPCLLYPCLPSAFILCSFPSFLFYQIPDQVVPHCFLDKSQSLDTALLTSQYPVSLSLPLGLSSTRPDSGLLTLYILPRTPSHCPPFIMSTAFHILKQISLSSNTQQPQWCARYCLNNVLNSRHVSCPSEEI